MKSYSSESRGVVGLTREIAGLYRQHSNDVAGRVRGSIADARRVEARLEQRYGMELRDLDVLEIGPGQFLSQLTYFAMANRAIGIDRDVIVRNDGPLAYLRMLETNGVRRTIKTVGRKLIGVDHTYEVHLMKELGLAQLPPIRFFVMDVCGMSFPDNNFDFVYSRAVLHHLPQPVIAMNEIARVLRPGGVAYVSIHPYTSETGCLDPRIYGRRRNEVLGWQHLRPGVSGTVQQPNVYLNRLRLEEWQKLFASKLPGVEYIVTRTDDSGALDRANGLQKRGELLDYSLDELLAGEFVALWKKPDLRSTKAHQAAQSKVPARPMVEV